MRARNPLWAIEALSAPFAHQHGNVLHKQARIDVAARHMLREVRLHEPARRCRRSSKYLRGGTRQRWRTLVKKVARTRAACQQYTPLNARAARRAECFIVSAVNIIIEHRPWRFWQYQGGVSLAKYPAAAAG